MQYKGWAFFMAGGLLLGCTERGPDSGIVVRNPGDTKIAIADGDGLVVTAAYVDGYQVEMEPCDSDGPRADGPRVVAQLARHLVDPLPDHAAPHRRPRAEQEAARPCVDLRK